MAVSPSVPGGPRSERLLLTLAALGLTLPVVGLLLFGGWLANRQLAVSEALLRTQHLEAALARGEQALRTLEERVVGADGTGPSLRLDGSGRVVAPRLPPAAGQPPQPAAATRDLLARGDELIARWSDPAAAITLYGFGLDQTTTAADEVALQLAILDAHLGRNDAEGILAVADRILALDQAEGGILTRRQQLLCHLVALQALQNLGRDELVRRRRGRLHRLLAIETRLTQDATTRFYLQEIAAQGEPLPPVRELALLNVLLQRSVSHLQAALNRPAGAVLPGKEGLLRLRRDPEAPATFLLEPLPPLAHLQVGLEPDPVIGWTLRPTGEPDAAAFPLTLPPEAGPREQRIVPGQGVLQGWELLVEVAPEAAVQQVVSQQRWTFGGLALGILLVVGAAVGLSLKAIRRAVALARARSDFIAGITHDLKTPLALIRLYAETLRLGRDRTPGDRNQFLDVILGESHRLERLIDNTLSFHRAGHKQAPRSTDLRTTVVQAVDGFPLPPDRTGPLRLQIPDALPPLPHDRQAVGRLLRNLVANAVKFSPAEGAIEVRVVDGAEAVTIEVADQGIGLASGEAERVFEPFFRSARKEVATVSGTGLGLAVVQQVAQAHQGQAEACSPGPGRGTTVRVRLPRGESDGRKP